MSIIEVQNLRKSFGGKSIFDSMSFTVEEGEFISIVGASGSGKSTLLNIIGLIERYDGGEVAILGKKIASPNSKQATKFIREHINYLFQNFALVPNMTVNENLLMALVYTKLNAKEKVNLIQAALDEVELKDVNKQKVFSLSGGEQQRVAIARVLLKKGELLLIDEPTASLDSENAGKVFRLIKKLQRDYARTILMVTHDSHLAMQTDHTVQIGLAS